jgi:hypothetical protein
MGDGLEEGKLNVRAIQMELIYNYIVELNFKVTPSFDSKTETQIL